MASPLNVNSLTKINQKRSGVAGVDFKMQSQQKSNSENILGGVEKLKSNYEKLSRLENIFSLFAKGSKTQFNTSRKQSNSNP